jgi:peroxiredoxin Q/BCP
VKRHTFVIGKDSRLLAEISSEMNMDLHADEALKVLAS